ncbi:MAG: phage tail protein [Proteobacteria bacterium]|nr:phage tail protein [Pseudomonadota bacterium]MBU1594269.1 phage tail protein [Pseudomonadota bacterium]
MPSEIVSLKIGGLAWKGWEDVTITRAVDAVSGSFEVALADRWSHDETVLPIAATMPVSILTRASDTPGAQADQLIRGYIDQAKPAFGATDHKIAISGRDASADLVDCAAVHKPGEWKNLTCSRLAEILAAPFGVAVRCEASEGAAIPVHKIEPGETAWECLERALRQRELLAMPDSRGGILINAIGTGRATTALVQGQNILSASADYDAKGRYSEYRVLAQNKGTDDEHGDAVAAVLGISRDETMGRYRPKVITGEAPKDKATAQRRADWENSVCAGRSASVEVTVQGWRQGDGTLWPLNAMCRAVIPYLFLDQDLMIGKVVHKLGSGGTTTTLTLRSPLAYAQEFEKHLKADKGGKGGGKGDLLTGAVELSKDEQARILAGQK